jgi:NADPH2:quinone reductase
MVGAYRMHKTGAPNVMQWEEFELSEPAAQEVRVKHTAIGLNYIDTYHRSGLYTLPLPSRLGVEAAGIVEAIGSEVTSVEVGQRVAYAGGLGAYAEATNMPASRLVHIPDGVTDEVAAASLLKGLTTCYLLTRTYKVTSDTTLLAHAAAGGVGLLLCQWARHLNATIIGTVGNADKAELAEANGANHTILYQHEDVVARVRELTQGKGVNVVYDSVGKSTYEWSLNSLAPLGMLVNYGNASGNSPAVEPHDLQNKGSLFFTRPTLATYAADPKDLNDMASEFFTLVSNGTIKVHINQRYALKDLIQAHIDLEARATTGSTVILP